MKLCTFYNVSINIFLWLDKQQAWHNVFDQLSSFTHLQWKSKGPKLFWTHLTLLWGQKQFFKVSFLCFTEERRKSYRFVNNTRVSKWWRMLYFLVNYQKTTSGQQDMRTRWHKERLCNQCSLQSFKRWHNIMLPRGDKCFKPWTNGSNQEKRKPVSVQEGQSPRGERWDECQHH